MLEELIARFEKHAPLSIMARVTPEHTLAPQWIDEVFANSSRKQYTRELLFSTVIGLMSEVTPGFSSSLHAAASRKEDLPVSITALYSKINRTEPDIMRALVQANARRLSPLMERMPVSPALPGWRVRIVDGNHLPSGEKRLAALRGKPGAALPGHALVVYDPDTSLVSDIVAIEDAYAQERSCMAPLLEIAQPGELWIADRNFCTAKDVQGWDQAGSHFIVREHLRHPRLREEGEWSEGVRIDTGEVSEQPVWPEAYEPRCAWRRIGLKLERPAKGGDQAIWLWSNLPASVSCETIAGLYRKRWKIEGIFQRLESVLQSEIRTLGNPRAALLGFTVGVLAYNALSVMKRSIEHAHAGSAAPGDAPLDVSTWYLAHEIRSQYEGMMVALPARHWLPWTDAGAQQTVERLLELALNVNIRHVRTRKREPKVRKPEQKCLSRTEGSAHFSTAREIEMYSKKAR